MKVIDDYPVFVMGAERSGTSTIAAFLNSKLGYAGNSEGHIFNLLSKILNEIRNHFSLNGFSILEKPKQDSGNKDERTTAQAISQSIIISETITLWGKLVRNQTKGLWVDKTPGPEFINCTPYLTAMYKNAKFLFLVRDPVAAIESNMRKFGSSFESACDRWRDCAEAWIQNKSILPEKHFLEIKTHELSEKPEQCLKSIVSLLSSHPLDLNKSNLSGMKFEVYERTSHNDLSRELSIESVDWSPDQQEYFNKNCKALAKYFGFVNNRDDSLNASIDLGLPVGQKNVDIIIGEFGIISPQSYESEMCIFMHPSLGGVETEIIWKEFAISGPAKVSCNVYLHPQAKTPVEFVMKTSSFTKGEGVESIVCNPGEKKEIFLQGSFIGQNNQLSVSVRSQTDSVDCAWAYISCPVISSYNLKLSNAP